MQEHQRILLTKMINIWEIRPRCLETAPAAQLQGDGWHSFPQPRIQEPKILPAAHLGSGQQTLPECKGSATAQRARAKKGAPSPGGRNPADACSKDRTAPFAAKENNSGTPMAKTIRKTTEQWPSGQILSERQRMKGQRNSKAALRSYWWFWIIYSPSV